MDVDISVLDSWIYVTQISFLVLQDHMLLKVLILSKHNESINHKMGKSWANFRLFEAQ